MGSHNFDQDLWLRSVGPERLSAHDAYFSHAPDYQPVNPLRYPDPRYQDSQYNPPNRANSTASNNPETSTPSRRSSDGARQLRIHELLNGDEDRRSRQSRAGLSSQFGFPPGLQETQHQGRATNRRANSAGEGDYQDFLQEAWDALDEPLNIFEQTFEPAYPEALETEANMPTETRRARRTRDGATIDLTANVPSSPARPSSAGRKRAAESSQEARASKRARQAEGDIEEVDLTHDQKVQKTEAGKAVQSQGERGKVNTEQDGNREGGGAGVKIGRRTCIICMETYTNATVTSCGHIYCHECLTQALNASAKNSDRTVGSCPACRKHLYPPSTKKGRDQMFPLAFMKKSAFKGKAKSAY